MADISMGSPRNQQETVAAPEERRSRRLDVNPAVESSSFGATVSSIVNRFREKLGFSAPAAEPSFTPTPPLPVKGIEPYTAQPLPAELAERSIPVVATFDSIAVNGRSAEELSRELSKHAPEGDAATFYRGVTKPFEPPTLTTAEIWNRNQEGSYLMGNMPQLSTDQRTRLDDLAAFVTNTKSEFDQLFSDSISAARAYAGDDGQILRLTLAAGSPFPEVHFTRGLRGDSTGITFLVPRESFFGLRPSPLEEI